MELVVYPLLSTRSRRAMLKTARRFGHYYNYRPRGNLIQRLSQQLNTTPAEVLEQIKKERNYLLKDL